ncbi:MAG: type II toxin-antitoxin system RatA family toxin, partial [Pseudohongiellaceae bacterium]
MARIARSALLPQSAARMFALVDDIPSYPHYLQGCLAAEVLEKQKDLYAALG